MFNNKPAYETLFRRVCQLQKDDEISGACSTHEKN
jgi:hypothetical protein